MVQCNKCAMKAPAAQLKRTEWPRATVAICTRNRRKSLARCLDSLRKQQASFDWDILVVDNGSTDGTHEVITRAQSNSDVAILTALEPKTGLTHARNRALSDARGDVVLMVDDDMTFEKGWLDAHMSPFTDQSIGATGGRTLPVFPESTPDWMRSELQSGTGGPCGHYDLGPKQVDLVADDPRLPMGGNMAIRRSCALELGGFSEALGIGNSPLLGEDTDLSRRIRSSGRRILYLPDATTHHHLEADKLSMSSISEYYRAYGRTEAFTRDGSGKHNVKWHVRNRVKYWIALVQMHLKKNPAKRMRHRLRASKFRGRMDHHSGVQR